MRPFLVPILVTLIGGWVLYSSPRGSLQVMGWLAVIVVVWAYALWPRQE